MTDQERMVHISARIPQKLRDQLDSIVRQRRSYRGDDVRMAEVVREALQEYVDRQ